MIAATLDVEVGQHVTSSVDEIDEDGKRLVVRNGRARERKPDGRIGTVSIRAPGVHASFAEGHRGAAGPVPARLVDRDFAPAL